MERNMMARRLLSIAVLLAAKATNLASAYITRSSIHMIDRPSRASVIKLKAYSSLNKNNYIYTKLEDATIKDAFQGHRDPQQVLSVIETAAYKAGEICLNTAGKIAIASTKTNIRDLVTKSDVQCQQVIKEIITQKFPNDKFLGEEGVDLSDDGSVEALKIALGSVDDSCLLFVVDPIDGTTNFQAGLPLYAISIGVVSMRGNQPEVVAGVIYNPTLKEMTSAVRGRGCYVNNQRIGQESNVDKKPRDSVLNSSLINIGFPIAKESTLFASSKAVSALATRVRGIRMIASASQTMAWVAQGKLDAYFSWDLNAWDIAAGVVIVEESGGLVSDFDGAIADVSSRDLIITSRPNNGEEGILRDELIAVLKENDCIEY